MAVENEHRLSEQRRITESLLRKDLVKDDTWYMVDWKWFKTFRSYVGLDAGNSSADIGQQHPGPVDNSSLVDEETGGLREHLLEYLDYVLVSEELWNHLLNWYGIVSDQPPLPRKVVETGIFSKNLKVEVYLLQLKLCKDFDFEHEIVHQFSKGDSLTQIADTAKELFNIPDEVKVRLWTSVNMNNTYSLLNMTGHVQNEGLCANQLVVVETSLLDGTWSKYPQISDGTNSSVYHLTTPGIQKCSTSVTPVPSKSSNSLTFQEFGNDSKLSRSSDDINRFSNRSVIDRAGVLHMNEEDNPTVRPGRYANDYDASCSFSEVKHTPGLCGLYNIGNTCFMNSVIQCMSNCPPITEYFVTGKYLEELNTVNPLGRRGEIATAFGELIKAMWSGQYSVTMPQRFKHQVGKFAPQFSGNNQNDCHELLTFLLDGLHEDLNRIKDKPYGELNDSNDQPDEVLAAEAWVNHHKRNDSVIIDNFHGLLKSTVECPECSKVSVTFDPFCYLSLPLPTKRERSFEVMLFPFDARKKPQGHKFLLPRNGCIRDLQIALGHVTRLCSDELLVTEIFKHHFHRFFSATDTLESIDFKDYIAVFEIPKLDNHVNIPVCLWQVNNKQNYNFSQLFGHPMILTLPESNCSFDDLYAAILVKLCRYILIPQENGSTWWNQVLSDGNSSNRYSALPHLMRALPRRLFTLHVVNASTASVVYKFKGDEMDIQMPFTETIGLKYLAAQWTNENHNRYFNSQILNDIEWYDPLRNQDPDRVQLSDCLALYTMCEKLGGDDAWYCPACKKHQRATKKIDLWSLPNILIIHLKRFSFTRYSRDKINTYVEFPTDDLDMSRFVINRSHPPVRYKLIGVCNHYGVLASGHYTAFALHKDTREWYNFDDTSVSPMFKDSVVSNSAYVLFYMRSE